MKKLTYIASPYAHEDKEVMEQRFQAVCEYAARLMREGVMIYCPIAHCHPIAQYGLPKGWEFWEELDRTYLQFCDKLVVFMLDGWDVSKGVQAEIQIAKEFNIPVIYFNPGQPKGLSI